jgi:hypothetical protein
LTGKCDFEINGFVFDLIGIVRKAADTKGTRDEGNGTKRVVARHGDFYFSAAQGLFFISHARIFAGFNPQPQSTKNKTNPNL